MADDMTLRNQLINRVKLRLRAVGVEFDGRVKWQVKEYFRTPEGFDFFCDKPLELQRMAERSSKLALDLDRPTPAGWASLQHCTVGFTEVGEGLRVHLDIGIDGCNQCRAYLDPHGDILGRDRFGAALRVIDNAVVQRVKRVARDKGIGLEGYQCQVVKTYNNGVEPPGFDFHCGGNMMFALHDYVKKLASFKFDDPEAKIEGGWLNQLVTRGSGYREKGYGPRLHIELAPKENWGNVHIDSHGFVRPDGSYDWHEALTRHGPYDLITGYLGGRVGGAKWTPTGNITYQRDRDHETDVIGLPDGRTPHPTDGGPDKKDRGWRLTLGIRLTF